MIPAVQEAEITAQGQARQKVSKTCHLNKQAMYDCRCTPTISYMGSIGRKITVRGWPRTKI
jgi:hypothetical protein